MKKRNILLVSLLWATTGGLYAIYWLYKVGMDCYKTCEPNSSKRLIPSAIVVLILIQVILVILTIAIGVVNLEREFIWIFLFVFSCIMLAYSLSFILVRDVANALCKGAGYERLCSPRLAVILTFLGFTSVIYLQASINKRLDLPQ